MGLNGEPDFHMTFAGLMGRRDALLQAEIINLSDYAWGCLRLAADFDAMGFLTNAARMRERGTHYMTLADGKEEPIFTPEEIREPEHADYTDI